MGPYMHWHISCVILKWWLVIVHSIDMLLDGTDRLVIGSMVVSY